MRKAISPTLAFYLGKRYFASLFLTTLVLSTLVFILEIVEITRKLGMKEGVEGTLGLKMVLLKMPDMMLQVVPFIILLGTLTCFAKLTKNQELTAVRACGLPARQFLLPPIIVCLAISVFNIVAFNPFAATMLKQYEHIHNEIFPGSTQGLVTSGGQIWLKQKDEDKEFLIYAQNVTRLGHELEQATLFIFNNKGEFQTRLDTPKMVLKEDRWVLKDVVRIEPGKESRKQLIYILPTSLKPEMIQNSFTSPNTLSIWELYEFISLLKETGFPSQKHELHWHKILASPALILAMFLLAAPFSLHFSRSAGTGKLLLLGLCFGFLFYFFTNLVNTQGMTGAISLSLAAWLPTAIAGLFGLAFFLHFREE